MALQIPGYQPPTPYAQNPDIIGNFGKGFDLASSIGNELSARDTLGEFVKSLYAGKRPVAPGPAPVSAAPVTPQSTSELSMSADPGNQLIGKSANAATGATDPVLAQYFATLAKRESGGNPNAQNPNSSAGGTYQITDPTWQALVAQNPNAGLTLDGKMDPQQQQTAVRLLTRQNAAALKQAGQPINPGTLYAAHFLGAPEATQVLGYADDTPMVSAVRPEVIKANPQLQDMTVGQFKQWAGVSGSSPQGGYQPPAADTNGLPPREVLTALFQNPDTREFAAKLVQAHLAQQETKPADQQPLINAGNGSIYDPNTKSWITQPSSAASAGPETSPVTFTDAGLPNPDEQAAFLKALDPNTAALVKGIADYQLDPTKTSSMRSDQRQKLISLVQQYDPTFDMSQYGARAQAKKAYTTGQQGQTITSANTVIGHLANLADDAAKLGNGNFVPFNAISNTVKGAMSNPDLVKFNSDKMAVASELAKFFKGTGATDLTTTQEWQSIFDQNTGPDALKATVQNVVANLMKSRLDEMRSQYTAAMGKPSDFKFITPETEQVLTKLGLKASDLDPGMADTSAPPPAGDIQEGATAVNPQTKQRIRYQGGAWVDAQTGQPVQ